MMLISLTDQGGVKLVLGICLHVTLILYSGVVNNLKKKTNSNQEVHSFTFVEYICTSI